MGEWECVFDCDSVDFPIIEYRSVTTVLLFDVEDRGCIRGL
jgi:hypothetical protein